MTQATTCLLERKPSEARMMLDLDLYRSIRLYIQIPYRVLRPFSQINSRLLLPLNMPIRLCFNILCRGTREPGPPILHLLLFLLHFYRRISLFIDFLPFQTALVFFLYGLEELE